MKVIEAKKLFTKTEFNGEVDWDTYPKSEYNCPECNEALSFTFKDFQKHINLNFSNLKSSDARVFDKKFSEKKEDYNSYLDFYCPNCGIATRVYYIGGSTGKGLVGLVLSFVALNEKDAV